MPKVCPHCREKLREEFKNMPIWEYCKPEDREEMIDQIVEAVEAAHALKNAHEPI
jgi:hypothetical protein